METPTKTLETQTAESLAQLVAAWHRLCERQRELSLYHQNLRPSRLAEELADENQEPRP